VVGKYMGRIVSEDIDERSIIEESEDAMVGAFQDGPYKTNQNTF